MFSGIVREIGTIENLESKNGILELTISCKELIKALNLGDSIAIDGCCQTVIETSPPFFKVQAVKETLNKTNFQNFKLGSKVNLEPSLKLNNKIDGHFVSGHIDTTGEVLEIKTNCENQIISISYPEKLSKFIAPKGSITVNGVSLTVIELKDLKFNFSLIPYSRNNTNLGLIKIGNLVNLEIDLLSRYIVNYLSKEKDFITKQYAN